MFQMRVALATVLIGSALLCAQTPTLQFRTEPATAITAELKQKPSDYAEEPFVIEQVITRMRFESDGTGRREVTLRVRVQSESGVQQFGQLVEGYNSANERMEIAYVRVRQPDGKVVTAGPEAVQDLTAPWARVAPVYTDLHQKHITVPALRPGQTLEFQVVTTLHTPLAPGQFWAEYDFVHEGGPIVLDEQLEIDIPKARTVKLKSAPEHSPQISEEKDRRIYRWQSSHKIRESSEELKKQTKEKKKNSTPDAPAVQLTTFPSWEALGAWYAELERERRVPSPEIKAKASALTAGRSSDIEKVQAIYDFVATSFRYVSLSFGLGRFQPHAAGEILGNQYGDCKDKHTLLAALLDAIGIRTSSVLIHSLRKIDPDMPSPSQFDHVISMVSLGQEQVWLDTTTEVAPFRALVSNLRDKQALVIPPGAPAKLMKTPADLPFAGTVLATAEGKVTPLGKLSSHVRTEMRDDSEAYVRIAFRRTPQTAWKELLEAIAEQAGVKGTVTDQKVDDPAATRKAFAFEFNIEQSGFLDWSKKKDSLELPFLKVDIPGEPDEDSTEPIKLGGPGERVSRLRLELPAKLKVRLPVPISVTRDYGEYSSTYKLENNVLTAERKLTFRQRELAVARAGDYAAFRRAAVQDAEQKLVLENPAPGAPEVPESAKAEDLYEAGNSALDGRQYAAAVEFYKRAVALEPKHKYAWNNLGRAYLALAQNDRAVQAFNQQIEINPFDQWAYNNLGRVLQRQHKYQEAIAAFKKQIEINPLDQFAHTNLGLLYLERKRWPEAVAELEKAVAITPDNPAAHLDLGRAYLKAGQSEKAFASFDRCLELFPVPDMWNDIAYELSVNKTGLERARQYAESSVASTSAMLRNLTEETIDSPQASIATLLAAAWDTLGWVRFQQGDVLGAEKWVTASWQLEQHGEVGDHLAQIYEKRGELQKAADTYALALAADNPPEETRGRLASLIGGQDKVDGLVAKARGRLSAVRTVSVGKLLNENVSAEFAVLLSSAAVVEGVKFEKGSDKLKPFADKLRALNYGISFPDETPTKVVLHGTLLCSPANGECVFVRNPRAGFALPEALTLSEK